MSTNNKKGLLVILGGIGFVVILSYVYFAHVAKITSPFLCEFCHNTYYDYREYAYNPKPTPASSPRGVLFGCAECHRGPFREFKNSDHSKSEKDTRPGCPNCHKPHNVITAARFMFTTSPLIGITGDAMQMDSRAWDSKMKPRLDKKVRDGFLKSNSKACTDCHKEKEVDWDLEAHQIAKKEKMTCIECHFNLVHKGSPWPEKEEKKEKLGI
ncbi:MAG: NapC/NirT family cytochrome c [Deltaproteobacteria bacterium]|nr:NapC/NirT family cytochrome c [Deltaproteobacteria bacterium]